MQICNQCGIEFEYGQRKNNSHFRCRKCYGRNRRNYIEQKICEYVKFECKNCGYNKCRSALHFHHREPSKKLFSIGAAKERSWISIKKEIDKCDILCANCHIELQYGIVAQR